jgi:hypothetical protein
MKKFITLLTLAAACSAVSAMAHDDFSNAGSIKRVLLLSIDGMHAV